MKEQSDKVCAYCGEEFESKHAEGVHRSKEHVDTNSKITKSKREYDSRRNIIEDKWSTAREEA